MIAPDDSNKDGNVSRREPVHERLQLESLWERFETQFHDDNSLRIEKFVQSEENLDPALLEMAIRELILIEVELAAKSDENLLMRDYLERFPEYEETIEEAFKRLENWETRVSASTIEQASKLLEGQFGKYEIRRKLGAGRFGQVYEAFDTELFRTVALKFPHQKPRTPANLNDTIGEAENVKGLHHPGIVQTYEICEANGHVFIVQQYVNGRNLKELTEKTPPLRETCVRIVAEVAAAMAYSHRQGIYHRDLKPTNIMIEERSGHALVADFGLAIHENVQVDHRGEMAGSPAYMSPEMVRGESHRIDGRSDIWSLGVILYEQLTGRRPFRGTLPELFDEIENRNPKPPRQIDDSIPVELERICLRCLDKQLSDRYSTAQDLARDLNDWLQSPDEIAGTELASIEPQGLMAYGSDQVNSFLRLLPGPRDRFGLPVSIRFWKTRIEQFANQETFSVGFIYGPSGSGKTSFVRAGVIPRLDYRVVTIYVEATTNDTEVRILKGLRRQFSKIPFNLSLPEVIRDLREGKWRQQEQKVLLVLDQFEQWLHGHGADYAEQLIQAIRHCNGTDVQALILVRDDFWLATSRFKKTLDAELIDGVNAMCIDRFDLKHARQVLIEFGRSYGCLPAGDMLPTNDRFLDAAVTGLSENDRVVPVRLSVFAEMMKDRPWNQKSIRNVGGVAGVGEVFLENAFAKKTSPPKFRVHHAAARGVLELLLPEGLDQRGIRGQRRSRLALMEAANYQDESSKFSDLLQVMEKELKLISPSDPDQFDGPNTLSQDDSQNAQYYQLTHDYLVPSIKNWVDRQKRGSLKGRLELRLNDYVEWESLDSENVAYPNAASLAMMLWAVPPSKRSPETRDYLSKAKRYVFSKALVVGLLAVVAIGVVVNLMSRNARRLAVEQLVSCDAAEVGDRIDTIRWYANQALFEDLEQRMEEGNDRQRFRAAYGLVLAQAPTDALQARALSTIIGTIRNLNQRELVNISESLQSNPEKSAQLLQKQFRESSDIDEKIRLGATELSVGSGSLVESMAGNLANPDDATQFILRFRNWNSINNHWSEYFANCTDAATLYTLTLSIGRLPSEEVPNAEREQIVGHLLKRYQTHPDAGVHFACQWTLKSWGINLPELPSSLEAPSDRDWWIRPVNGVPTEFVRIKPGSFLRGEGAENMKLLPDEEVTIQNEFWMASRETPFQILGPFVENKIGLPDNLMNPAYGLSVVEIGQFFNKLNQDDPVFSKLKNTTPFEKQEKTMAMNSETIGFRLPTPDEWELAYRAGSRTAFFWGTSPDDPICEMFANIRRMFVPSVDEIPVSTRMPSRAGLFDMVGSVGDMCRADMKDETKFKFCVCRGGSATSTRLNISVGWYNIIDVEKEPINDLNQLEDEYSTREGFRMILIEGLEADPKR